MEYYNLRSTRKMFKPEDKVSVLLPDSSNKLLARWQGPGVIESLKNEHSFLVKNARQCCKTCPSEQNKGIRGDVNVIFEEEFGEVEDAPIIAAKDNF
ncbi:hypothetical protein JTE90_022571 [Oedothorax gibbosus]|uniref:Vitellogenin n=1 Tax=Oedothorax gibbosus TaxID=931172 RepID=A0AAV6TER9_9ARAC|nr:hypothetical protein JTE90_022571 [Oedothorax gibbosus]